MSEAEKKQELVTVKILNAVGRYAPGTEIQVSEEEAGHLCVVKSRNDGHGVLRYQNAMRKDDWEASLKKNVKDKAASVTQGELAEMGLKDATVVETPKDPAYEANLKKMAESNAKKEEEKAKKLKTAQTKVAQKKAALEDKSASA